MPSKRKPKGKRSKGKPPRTPKSAKPPSSSKRATPKRATPKRATPKQGPSKRDIEKARALRERSRKIDRDVRQRKNEKRSAYLKRRSRAKAETPRGAPPSKTFKNNKTYQRRRGYYYKDASGKWRTPDGRVAKGQRLVQTDKGRTYELKKARSHNAKNRAKLVREDAYVSLLSRGAYLSRAKFNRIVGKSTDRSDVSRKLRRAHERGELHGYRGKPDKRAVRRDIRESFDRDSTIALESGREAYDVSREGSDHEPRYVNERTGREISQSELESIWEADFYGDFDYDEWESDFDSDGGDTP